MKRQLESVCVGLIMILFACHGYDFVVELQNGYKLWKMNANEIYIGNRDDVLVVGPGIMGIETKKEYVFGLVARAKSNAPDIQG